MNELLIGVDWSQSHYDVAVLSTNGALLSQFRVAKSVDGFSKLAQKINQFGVHPSHCQVGIETGYNILIDFLRNNQYQIYVVAPSIVHSSRGRFGNSGAYTDAKDAHLIADLLRTDSERFIQWQPDSDLLTTIKANLAHISHLTKMITKETNHLRHILLRVYPQVLHAFQDLNSFTALNLLVSFPTEADLRTLSFSDFVLFCRDHNCHRMDWITSWYHRLHEPQPSVSPVLAIAYQSEIIFIAQHLISLIREKKQLVQQAQRLFQQHPDEFIFSSLPGAGALLQPRLLVMFGEDRLRFPSPGDIRALAGTAPITKQSGKRRGIYFRRACNHSFRETAQQFAIASAQQADWASAYFYSAQARGIRKNHAYRCLANRWLGIIWKMWQTNQPYDEEYHLKQIHKQRQAVC